MTAQPPARVLVSAHRCGAGTDVRRQNSREALEETLALGVDFVEFDVLRTADGVFVVSHAKRVGDGDEAAAISTLTLAQVHALSPGTLTLDEILGALAGRASAHVDLKLGLAAGALEVAQEAVAHLGAEQVVVTTGSDESIAAIRSWADARGHDLLVGLSLGGSKRGLPWRQWLAVRYTELRPRGRVARSGANVVVVQHLLARFGVARWARRHGVPLLAWTVDSDRALRYWLRPGRAWMVTTNHPARALAVRQSRVERMGP